MYVKELQALLRKRDPYGEIRMEDVGDLYGNNTYHVDKVGVKTDEAGKEYVILLCDNDLYRQWCENNGMILDKPERKEDENGDRA